MWSKDKRSLLNPRMVNWLLFTYARPDILLEGYQTIVSLKQGERETQTDFASRLKKAHNQVGNLFPDRELKNIFIDGLSPGVRPMVTEFGKSHMALVEIGGLASSLREAFRNQLSYHNS